MLIDIDFNNVINKIISYNQYNLSIKNAALFKFIILQALPKPLLNICLAHTIWEAGDQFNAKGVYYMTIMSLDHMWDEKMEGGFKETKIDIILIHISSHF